MLRILRKRDFGKLKRNMTLWVEDMYDGEPQFRYLKAKIADLCISVDDNTWEHGLSFDSDNPDVPRFLNYDLYCERRALLINEKEFSNELDR